MGETFVLDDFYESSKPTKNIEYVKDDNNCFICTSHAVNPSGYYKIKRYSTAYDMHKWIYLRYHGEIEKGLVVRHKCNNKGCINPEHLAIGTYSQNALDSIDEERNYITKEIVLKVRDLLEEGYKQYEVAKMLNLRTNHISKIHNKTIWGSI